MKTLTISVAYNGQPCKCFVQLFDESGDSFCIVNFSDAELIKEYKGKKVILSVPAIQQESALTEIIQARLLKRLEY